VANWRRRKRSISIVSTRARWQQVAPVDVCQMSGVQIDTGAADVPPLAYLQHLEAALNSRVINHTIFAV